MKNCPTCNRTYHDEFSFCLVDGSVLSAPYRSDETQIMPSQQSGNFAPTEVIEPKAFTNSEVIEFTEDEEGYRQWVQENPSGFVIHTTQTMNPNRMFIHRANCGHISSLDPQYRFVGNGNAKVCASDIERLKKWIRLHGRPDGSFSRVCKTCKPIEEEATTPKEYTLENLPGALDFLKSNRATVKQVLQEITQAGMMNTEELNTRIRRQTALRLALFGLLECDNFSWGYGKLRHYRINPNPPEKGLKLLEEIYQRPTENDNWHGYVAGQQVAASEVVAKCLQYLSSGKVENSQQKLKGIEAISRHGQAIIVYAPQGKGWGNSPMNPNCWQTVDGKPI